MHLKAIKWILNKMYDLLMYVLNANVNEWGRTNKQAQFHK